MTAKLVNSFSSRLVPFLTLRVYVFIGMCATSEINIRVAVQNMNTSDICLAPSPVWNELREGALTSKI